MESEPPAKDATHKGEPPAPQPGRDVATTRRRIHRRIGETMATAHRRVRRPRVRRPEPLWLPAYDRVLLFALALIAALSLFDAAAIRYVRAGSSPLFSAMSAITDIGQSHWYL
ncbi:MAG TPA: hypothetical protein GX405_19165, partial [Rhizobiales bacterium]|nr:hypothetical protein [Hyphomicrobiales bacterium]